MEKRKGASNTPSLSVRDSHRPSSGWRRMSPRRRVTFAGSYASLRALSCSLIGYQRIVFSSNTHRKRSPHSSRASCSFVESSRSRRSILL